jgi:hypothetical protein
MTWGGGIFVNQREEKSTGESKMEAAGKSESTIKRFEINVTFAGIGREFDC